MAAIALIRTFLNFFLERDWESLTQQEEARRRACRYGGEH